VQDSKHNHLGQERSNSQYFSSLVLRVYICWSSENYMGNILVCCLLTFESKFPSCVEAGNKTPRGWQDGCCLSTSSQDKINKVSS